MPGSTLKKSQRNQELSAMCFWRCPCWKKLLSDLKMLVQLFLLHNFLHNHMRYIYRQIYGLKGKEFCLSEISFLQTVVQTKFSVLARQVHRLHWVWIQSPSEQVLLGLLGSMPCTPLVTPHLTLGSPQSQHLGLLL